MSDEIEKTGMAYCPDVCIYINFTMDGASNKSKRCAECHTICPDGGNGRGITVGRREKNAREADNVGFYVSNCPSYNENNVTSLHGE